MTNIYCEGAAAAEILFSLTGGREGRLMSYNPPVTIHFGDAYKASCACIDLESYIYQDQSGEWYSGVKQVWRINKYIYTIKKIANAVETHYTEPNYQGYGFPIKYYDLDNQLMGTVDLWTCDFKNHSQPSFAGFAYTPEESPQEWDKSYGKTMKYGLNIPVKNLLLIQDIESVLYAHSVPEGFTPTWQVNCIDCADNECAGSNGKEGVTCMDCKQMELDIKYMQSKLR